MKKTFIALATVAALMIGSSVQADDDILINENPGEIIFTGGAFVTLLTGGPVDSALAAYSLLTGEEDPYSLVAFDSGDDILINDGGTVSELDFGG